jgi:hypothetical protein
VENSSQKGPEKMVVARQKSDVVLQNSDVIGRTWEVTVKEEHTLFKDI